MIKLVRRFQSTAAAEFYRVNQAIKDFSDFPMKYHKNLPDITDIDIPEHLYKPGDIQGFKSAYDLFLTLFAEERYTELAEITEHNLLNKLIDT